MRIGASEVESEPLCGLVEAGQRAEIRVVADSDRVVTGDRLDGEHAAVVCETIA